MAYTEDVNQGSPGQVNQPWYARLSDGSAALDPRLDPDYLVASTGLLGGVAAQRVFIIGRRQRGWDNTSTLADVCEYLDTTSGQSLMHTPTVGQTLYLVSTSTDDDAAGTGVRTVRIVYLDNTGAQQVTTATMDGTTPVSLGTGFSFIQWMEAATHGSSEIAAGDITISSTNGAATVATTFEMIALGANRSMSGRYKVPTGKTAYLHSWDAGAIGNTMDVRLRADVFADDRSASPGVFHFQDVSYLGVGEHTDGKETHFLKCPAGTVIKVSAIPGAAAAGNRCDCSFDMLVVG